ncbi:MAG TPA: zinc ABC transporter substrate-binding protein [Hyphomicrobiaceae bacterium]|nr:zinc ABC transporter substrate-binding protein [Hyphomicrobiaceae bacterium]
MSQSCRFPRTASTIAAAALWLAVAGTARGAPPEVIATVKPVHSIAAAVMDGVGVPRLLIDGAASPHTYALKPSDAKALNGARLIIRVSPGLETFLDSTLKSLPKSVRVLSLDRAEGMVLLAVRTGANFDGDDHGHGHGHGKSKSAAMDAHIWLDPRNAAAIAGAVAGALSDIDPANAEAYRTNAKRASDKFANLDRELESLARPLAGKPFVVFHDAYQYAEKRYGLTAVGAITVSPEIQPSAKRLQALRRTIQRLHAHCVFVEPQFPPKLIDTIIEGSKARRGTVDPLGVAIPAGPDHYATLMRTLIADFAACLAPRS